MVASGGLKKDPGGSGDAANKGQGGGGGPDALAGCCLKRCATRVLRPERGGGSGGTEVEGRSGAEDYSSLDRSGDEEKK